MPNIAITGTNTDIGKTYVACGIADELHSRGIDVGVFKPFCSGERDDAEKLIKYSGCGDSIDEVNPFYFEQPLAPFHAARNLNTQIDIQTCFNAYDIIRQRHDIVIIEGAGGIMVPISCTPDGIYTFRDLFADMACDVLIVASRELGTINHSWLTAHICIDAGVNVIGFVFNDARPITETEPAISNPEIVELCSQVPVLGIVKHNDKQPPWHGVADKILNKKS